MAVSYREWKEFAVSNYDTVREQFHEPVYQGMVRDKDTLDVAEVSLTLQEVMDMCENTIFETALRRAVMKCVYTRSGLIKEVRKVMDVYYGIWDN